MLAEYQERHSRLLALGNEIIPGDRVRVNNRTKRKNAKTIRGKTGVVKRIDAAIVQMDDGSGTHWFTIRSLDRVDPPPQP